VKEVIDFDKLKEAFIAEARKDIEISQSEA